MNPERRTRRSDALLPSFLSVSPVMPFSHDPTNLFQPKLFDTFCASAAPARARPPDGLPFQSPAAIDVKRQVKVFSRHPWVLSGSGGCLKFGRNVFSDRECIAYFVNVQKTFSLTAAKWFSTSLHPFAELGSSAPSSPPNDLRSADACKIGDQMVVRGRWMS